MLLRYWDLPSAEVLVPRSCLLHTDFLPSNMEAC